MIVTDLNNRERARLARMMAAIVDGLVDCRKSLLEEDDSNMCTAFIVTALLSKELRAELLPIITASLKGDIPDGPESVGL